jgi:hypothetical protein
MFQAFHLSSNVCCECVYLDVSKVDRVLHMLQCDPPAAAAGRGARCRVGRKLRVGQAGAWTPHGVR